MGGLKRYLPVTYWTFLIGSLAIAGVPPLAGFFSKDELLYETFHEGHAVLWLIGAITSLLTATYMFRLVFLTFHGERREGVAGATSHGPDAMSHGHGAASHGHDAMSHGPDASSHRHSVASHGPDTTSHHHDTGSHLHDAPPAMALVLIVLAVGSVVAGFVGIPHALGGHNALGAWLAPSFQVPGAEAAEAVEDTALELALMVVSTLIAFAGIGLAAFVWLKRRELADALARQYAGVYRVLLNKYYVDELYDAAIVRPIQMLSQEGLWRGFDVRVVDGAVNGTGSIVGSTAGILRRLQTGSVRAYASSLFIGVVVILGYYLWR
jgi:NADH-quinone oxidoreductase subunit L